MTGKWIVKKRDIGFWSYPYVVYYPDGWVATVTSTLSGARRAIRKRKALRQSAEVIIYQEDD